MKKLDDELLHGLEVIPENARDLQSLTIWCNSNYKRGSDKKVKISILKILQKLEKENKITKKNKKFNVYNGSETKNFELYSLL